MKHKSNIVLIGMPGSGKSTIGVLLAKRLGMSFLDTDVLIQAHWGRSLQELIQLHRMEGFCRIEQEYVRSINAVNTVIATGGSVVYYKDAMQALGVNGLIVYLRLPLEPLQKRLGDLNLRGVVFEPGQTLAALYAKRIPLYEQWADISVDLNGLNHEDSVKAILDKLNAAKRKEH
ncbi:MAG: shikimate kinase [Phycisphaerae bacterium]|nr:shikimate kinase [Phycisphaerae bacterium]